MAADEIERLRRVTEWQLIESAPRDGSWILGLLDNGDVRRIRSDVFYLPCWTTGEFYQGMNREPVTVEPTHWMPMLVPPKNENKEGR